jgi:hypothetical protein
MVLSEEFQSLGTAQLVPEVRKTTVVSACAFCGNERSGSASDNISERMRSSEVA